MYIAGGNHRLCELFSQLYDPAVQITDVFHRIYVSDTVTVDHEPVISHRLDLQIIIKADDLCNPGIRLFTQQSLIKFSCLAGASHQQAFPVSGKYTFRDPGSSGIIFQMRLGDQGIQIHPPHFIAGQDDHMIRGKFFHHIFTLGPEMIQLRQIVDPFVL